MQWNPAATDEGLLGTTARAEATSHAPTSGIDIGPTFSMVSDGIVNPPANAAPTIPDIGGRQGELPPPADVVAMHHKIGYTSSYE